MRTHCILFLLIVFGHQLFGQAPGFNKRMTCSYPNATIYKLLIENDTIIALGDGYSDSTFTQKGLVLMKFDTTGTLIVEKFIFDTLFSSTPLYLKWGTFIATDDGGYILNVIPKAFEYQMIIKIDRNFNTQFINKYSRVDDLDYQLCNITKLQDGYFIFGSVFKNDGFSDGLIRKISLEGDSIWELRYGNIGNSEVVIDVEKNSDSTYIVLAGKIINQTSARNMIFLINDEGAIVQSWDSEPEPPTGYLRNIIKVEDDGLLLYGMKLKTILPNGVLLLKSSISKVDHEYNLLWAKEYGKEVALASEIMFYNFEETIDGNFIAAGRTSTVAINNGPTYARGWLMKFSPEGDSIWSRLDTSDVMPVHYLNRQRFGGVGVLSSGSIIAGGYVTNVEDNSSYIWLIKTTNDGCIDTLYCGLVSATVPEPPKARQQVSVYPNPASEVVHIETDGNAAHSLAASMYDATGRRLQGVFWDDGSGKLSLQVGGFRAGIYFLSLKFPDGTVQYKKISILH